MGNKKIKMINKKTNKKIKINKKTNMRKIKKKIDKNIM
jgi:hypothetical protein